MWGRANELHVEVAWLAETLQVWWRNAACGQEGKRQGETQPVLQTPTRSGIPKDTQL